MINSRWPRPIGIRASMALMPVWTGVSTPWRAMTPGAIRSTGRVAVAAIGPLSSIGRPSGSTTRPSKAAPTGTSTTRPVVLTVSPSLIAVEFPRMTAPTVSSSRFRAMPITPPGNSRSSDDRAPERPQIWAIPSPTSTTVPTLRDSAPASKLSIVFLMMLTISSERMAIPSPFGRGDPGLSTPNLGADLPRLGRSLDQPPTQPLEAATDAGVDPSIADFDGEHTDQPRVNGRGKFHLGAGELFHARPHRRQSCGGEWLRRGHRGGDDAASLPHLGVVFGTYGG